MNESTTKPTKQFSGCASLAALGVQLRQLDVFGPIGKTVRIAQKTVKHTPIDKVYDAFISLLAGAHGLVEINTRLRADPALQKAFGRSSCAEQSVVQETLDHCSAENVSQMEQALDTIYRQHSQGSSWPIVIVAKAEPATSQPVEREDHAVPQARFHSGWTRGRKNIHPSVVRRRHAALALAW